MSESPAGFKTRTEYNAYMRDYKAKRRAKNLEHEVEILLSHTKLPDEDSQQVQKFIAEKKYFEARNLILFVMNQKREKEDFAINLKRQELISKYLRSDPKYLKMSPEGQHYWDLILSKHIDLYCTIISQGQYLIKEEDSEHYKKLAINTDKKIETDLLNDLIVFFQEQMKLKTNCLKHVPSFNIPEVKIDK